MVFLQALKSVIHSLPTKGLLVPNFTHQGLINTTLRAVVKSRREDKRTSWRLFPELRPMPKCLCGSGPSSSSSLMKPCLFLGLSELSSWDSATIFKVNIQTLWEYFLVFSRHCVFTKPSTLLSLLTPIPAWHTRLFKRKVLFNTWQSLNGAIPKESAGG